METESPFVTLESDTDLLAQALQLEYRIIVHYPRLLPLLPDEESRKILLHLGVDSMRHADSVAQMIRSLGKEPPVPIFDPLPDVPIKQTLERQLEYERLALALHTRAAELASPEHQAVLRLIAKQEQWHVIGVQQILAKLG